jgi:hypothetical protein
MSLAVGETHGNDTPRRLANPEGVDTWSFYICKKVRRIFDEWPLCIPNPLPQGGEGSRFELPLPSPLWGRGAGGEGVELGPASLSEQYCG